MKIKNKKRYLIYLITFIFSVIATLQFGLSMYAQNEISYIIDVEKDNKINSIYVNDSKKDLSRIDNDSLKYLDEKDQLIVISDTTLKIDSSIIDNVTILFDSNCDVSLTRDGIEGKIKNGLYFYRTSIIENIISSLDYYLILVFMVFSLIIHFSLKFILKTFNKIKEDKLKLKDIVIYISSIFIIYLSCFYLLLSVLKIMLLIPIVISLIYIMHSNKDSIKKDLKNSYILIAPIVGITMLFILPPFNVPDEAAHFVKSYSQTSLENINDNGRIYLPTEVNEFIYKYKDNVLNYDAKYNGKNYFSDLLNQENYNEKGKEAFGYGNTKSALPFVYLPSTMAIFFGILLNLSPLLLLLLGKFVNLLICIILGYYSLCKAPKFKKAIFIILLLPIYLQQSAAINMDYLTNSIGIYFISNVLYYAYSNVQFDKKAIIRISIILLLLCICKFGYFPLAFLLLIIPNKKFKYSKKRIIFIKFLMVFLTIITSLLLNNASNIVSSSTTNNYYTIGYIFQNPLKSIMIYLNTLWRIDLDVFRGLFDGFGWSTKWNSSLILCILQAIYIILILCKDKDDKKLSIRERIIYLILFAIMFAMMYTAMFIGWTKMGATVIDGLQPRYFILADLILYIGASNRLLNINVKNNNIFYTICIGIVYTLVYTTLLLEFY